MLNSWRLWAIRHRTCNGGGQCKVFWKQCSSESYNGRCPVTSICVCRNAGRRGKSLCFQLSALYHSSGVAAGKSCELNFKLACIAFVLTYVICGKKRLRRHGPPSRLLALYYQLLKWGKDEASKSHDIWTPFALLIQVETVIQKFWSHSFSKSQWTRALMKKQSLHEVCDKMLYNILFNNMFI